MKTDQLERVEAAAILQDGKVWTLPRPARHCDIISHMILNGGGNPCGGECGFVASFGRFVGRHEAWEIAARSGQIVAQTLDDALFSEDVW